MMRAVGFIAAFIVAIGALQRGWAQLTQTWDAPTPAGWAATFGYLVVFLVAFLYLGYWLYAQDRDAGRVRRRIGLYEWFLQKGPGGTRG